MRDDLIDFERTEVSCDALLRLSFFLPAARPLTAVMLADSCARRCEAVLSEDGDERAVCTAA